MRVSLLSVHPYRSFARSSTLLQTIFAAVFLTSFVACSIRTAPDSVVPAQTDAAPPRVILFSWDGAAHWTTIEALERADLPQIQRLVDEGAWADGMVSTFPTKTAAAHAALWTGRFGHQSGITANSILLEPLAEHSRLETKSGYFSDGLRTEPLWVATARAGLETYALHATQSYPYSHAERWLGAGEIEHLHLLNGYTFVSHRPAVFSQRTHPSRPASGWAAAEARTPGAREVPIALGKDDWWALLFDSPNDPVDGLDSVGLARTKQGALEFLLEAGPDAAPSVPIDVSRDGVRLNATLRLFALDPAGDDYLLYLSGARELTPSSDRYPAAAQLPEEVYAGNGAGWAYESGAFGPTIPQGGDGTAEDRFLLTLSDLADQLGWQARQILDRRDYSLFIHYSPILDDATHTWGGYLDPTMPGHDPVLAEALWPKLIAAFRLNERLLEDVLAAADRDSAHVILVSDHGMAGTNRLLNVNVALERAGLLYRTAENRIDLERTRALLLPTSDASVAVNTTDRAGGIVPPTERDAVLDAVREALGALRDPATGEPLVTGFFEPATTGLLQPGGTTTGDLFLDVAPGYYFSDRLQPDELVSETPPDGNHIFLPTRAEMLSICFVHGPGVEPGTRWPRTRSVDIAPTVLDILGLPIPSDLPGRSLLAAD